MAMLCRPSVVRPQFQRSPSLKPLGQLKPNFMWSVLRKGERGPGHMTMMAAMPIYGKNHKKIFSGTGGPISTKLVM